MPGKLFQAQGVGVEGFEQEACGFGVVPGFFATAVQAPEADGGEFLILCVAPGGFAEDLGVCGGVEDVVDDLKGEAQVMAELAEGVDFAGAGTGTDAADFAGAGDEACGFLAVDVDEACGIGGKGFCGEVFNLSADNALAAAGGGEFEDEGVGGMREGGMGFGHPLAGEGEEGVAGEEGVGFSELDVGGGFSAAEVVIVHAGQVIMHEGIGMEEFECEGGAECAGGVASHGLADGESEDGPQTFSAIEAGVAHGLMNDSGMGIGGGEVGIQSGIHPGLG